MRLIDALMETLEVVMMLVLRHDELCEVILAMQQSLIPSIGAFGFVVKSKTKIGKKLEGWRGEIARYAGKHANSQSKNLENNTEGTDCKHSYSHLMPFYWGSCGKAMFKGTEQSE
jgi:hypothetical protein